MWLGISQSRPSGGRRILDSDGNREEKIAKACRSSRRLLDALLEAGKSRLTTTRRKISMRFMMIYKPTNVRDMEEGIPPTPEQMAEMGKLIGEMAQSGKMLASDGLQGTSKGARVKLSDGKVAVTDGPFTETKELIGGFAIFQLESKAEAIELSERFLRTAGDGEVEIRQMHDNPAFAR
jgi:hypothetical protein